VGSRELEKGGMYMRIIVGRRAVARQDDSSHGRKGARKARLVGAALAAMALALVGASPLSVGASSAARATAASTITLNDSAHLRLTSHHGFTLNEQGSASGTIAGTIYIHLNVVSTNRVTAEVSLYPSGSSITGEASASYRPSGAVASFSGTMTVERGTGRYNHAHGTGLSFSGTVQRSNDAVSVHVSGRIST
jgi:hypothetical protein